MAVGGSCGCLINKRDKKTKFIGHVPTEKKRVIYSPLVLPMHLLCRQATPNFVPSASRVLLGGAEKSHFLVLKDLQEEWGKEFIGTLHLHVEEAAGMASPYHA